MALGLASAGEMAKFRPAAGLWPEIGTLTEKSVPRAVRQARRTWWFPGLQQRVTGFWRRHLSSLPGCGKCGRKQRNGQSTARGPAWSAAAPGNRAGGEGGAL